MVSVFTSACNLAISSFWDVDGVCCCFCLLLVFVVEDEVIVVVS